MAYDLFSQSTAVSRKLSRQSWAKVLELAGLYGWRPKGTQPPSDLDFHQLSADWHGVYLTNDGQTVTSEDAFSLAAALERALDDIPDRQSQWEWEPELWTADDDYPEWLSPDEIAIIEDGLEGELFDVMGIHPCEFFAGAEKRDLISFIRFCRLGSFVIT